MLKEVLKKLGYFDLVAYLIGHTTLFAKYYTFFSLNRKAQKKSFLIYTMGKVGSTTIRESLKNQLKNYSVYHVHWLNRKNLNTDQKFSKEFYHRNKNGGFDSEMLPNYIIRGFYINNKISRTDLNNDKYKIITLTRDPIARNISSFFQNLQKFYSYNIDQRLEKRREDVVAEELKVLFLSEYIDKNHINFLDSDPLTWFDDELKAVFGIDVFSKKFPKEKGYDIYQKGSISVLLIRLENLDDCLSDSFKEFLGEDIAINKLKNTGEKKEYAAVYKKFKESIELPNWYLDKMYGSKYAKHFYTEGEILDFRNK